MHSSRSHNRHSRVLPAQMGLDFIQTNQYISVLLEGDTYMESELFEKLEQKISDLLADYAAVKQEKQAMEAENKRLMEEREALKVRIDAIISKLEGV